MLAVVTYAVASGHGWWPGQVMPIEFAPAKLRRQPRQKTMLLSFFGDNSAGWFDLDCMEPFEPHYTARKNHVPKLKRDKVKPFTSAAVQGKCQLGCCCKAHCVHHVATRESEEWPELRP